MIKTEKSNFVPHNGKNLFDKTNRYRRENEKEDYRPKSRSGHLCLSNRYKYTFARSVGAVLQVDKQFQPMSKETLDLHSRNELIDVTMNKSGYLLISGEFGKLRTSRFS